MTKIRASIALPLFLILNIGYSSSNNSILALVNDSFISSQSIERYLIKSSSFDDKMAVIDHQIDIVLQLEKVHELGINPSQYDINEAITELASSNNITVEQLQTYPEYESFLTEIINYLSIINLQQHITGDLKFEFTKDEISKNCNINKAQKIKQIKIAEIIISEILDSNSSKIEQKNTVIRFLEKLSKHISKGASFEAFAKLHSQHPSYYNGGLSEWMFVNTPNIEMFDSLQNDEVSKIYETDGGWAIATKIDERYVDLDLEKCKKKLIYLQAQKFYADWLEGLRDSAYIKIYSDKL